MFVTFENVPHAVLSGCTYLDSITNHKPVFAGGAWESISDSFPGVLRCLARVMC